MSVLALAALAAEITFRSAGAVSLVELYTSEGCSSCPPADEWLVELADDPGLWNTFVPLSFHVDYWDYIGWKDRFSTPEFSQRHHDYGRAWRVTTVYTPSVVRDGAIWPGWRKATSVPGRTTSAVPQPTPPLALTVDPTNGSFRVETSPSIAGCRLAHVAAIKTRARSKVTAGENRGRTLEHAFVVLEHHASKIDARTGTASGRIALAAADAAATWLTPCDSPTPLQATGGPLGRAPKRAATAKPSNGLQHKP